MSYLSYPSLSWESAGCRRDSRSGERSERRTGKGKGMACMVVCLVVVLPEAMRCDENYLPISKILMRPLLRETYSRKKMNKRECQFTSSDLL